MTKAQKTYAIIEHLRDAIEQDRKILSRQWENKSEDPRRKARYENNQRKLDNQYYSLIKPQETA